MSERKCAMCQRDASRLLVRSELGGRDDRMFVCADAKCRPPDGQQWQDYALDGPALAKEYEEKST